MSVYFYYLCQLPFSRMTQLISKIGTTVVAVFHELAAAMHTNMHDAIIMPIDSFKKYTNLIELSLFFWNEIEILFLSTRSAQFLSRRYYCKSA
jgi:hypothetical protein